MTDFDVLMVGNFARDKLIVDGVEQISSGGGVYYGSMAIRRLGLTVAVATRLHPDDFPRLEELEKAGVVVFATRAEDTSGIANYYRSENMESRDCVPIGFGGCFVPENIPDIHPKVILVTPLYEGELDLQMLELLSGRAPLGLDIQGFVRVIRDGRLVFESWPQISEGLKLVHYLKVDKAEAQCLTGLSDIQQAARALAAMGPKEIVLTQTSGVTVLVDGEFHQAPFNPRSLAGRTGRGDTCFSTYIARRLYDSAQNACRWAAVITSQKQETPGPWAGTPEEVAGILKLDQA